jgi:hypothetical protein
MATGADANLNILLSNSSPASHLRFSMFDLNIDRCLKSNNHSEGLLGHDVVEVLAGDLPSVRGSPLQHLLQLLNVHSFSELLGDPADVVGVHGAGVVVVEEIKDLVDSILAISRSTLLSLSPSLEVMPSRNSSKSTSLPRDSSSAIMLKMVGFLDSKPRLCMADLSSRGSILPVASVSKRLKASRSSSTSSSVSPGRSTFFLAGPFAGTPFRIDISIKFKLNQIHQLIRFA